MALTTGVSRWLLQACALFNTATAILVVISVSLRYIFFAPLHFTEEITGFGLVFIVFMSQSALTIRRRHISVSLIYDLMPHRWRQAADVVSALLVAAASLYIAWYAWLYIEPSIAGGATTDAAQLLLYPWMLPMVAGMVLNAVAACIDALSPAQQGV